MTQTAVDYLFERLSTLYLFKDALLAQRALEEAKAMEKEQIIDAYTFGYTNGFDDAELNTKVDDAEQYCKETYNNKL